MCDHCRIHDDAGRDMLYGEGGQRMIEEAAKTAPNAMHATSAAMLNGDRGFALDRARTTELFRAAAAQGQPNAQKMLSQTEVAGR